jgi:hypothetical protein
MHLGSPAFSKISKKISTHKKPSTTNWRLTVSGLSPNSPPKGCKAAYLCAAGHTRQLACDPVHVPLAHKLGLPRDITQIYLRSHVSSSSSSWEASGKLDPPCKLSQRLFDTWWPILATFRQQHVSRAEPGWAEGRRMAPAVIGATLQRSVQHCARCKEPVEAGSSPAAARVSK